VNEPNSPVTDLLSPKSAHFTTGSINGPNLIDLINAFSGLMSRYGIPFNGNIRTLLIDVTFHILSVLEDNRQRALDSLIF
jgi:hypothetical protein